MTRCIQCFRDFLECVLYEFTLYLLTYSLLPSHNFPDWQVPVFWHLYKIEINAASPISAGSLLNAGNFLSSIQKNGQGQPANRNCYRLSRVSWTLLKLLVQLAIKGFLQQKNYLLKIQGQEVCYTFLTVLSFFKCHVFRQNKYDSCACARLLDTPQLADSCGLVVCYRCVYKFKRFCKCTECAIISVHNDSAIVTAVWHCNITRFLFRLCMVLVWPAIMPL